MHADDAADGRLLDAILAHVAGSRDPAVARFADAVATWGQEHVPVPPFHRPVSDALPGLLDLTVPGTRGLLAAFARERQSRKWEQSYTRADNLVGEDMLSGYGFAEVIGKWGPFVSEKVRAGIGIWGPDIDYPPHRHGAEEVYVVLAGAAEFRLAGEPPRVRKPGEAVHVTSMRTHGFRTADLPLAVFYIWQSGDLRETSRFD